MQGPLFRLIVLVAVLAALRAAAKGHCPCT
jgi:hypothetical protein